jgi:outer membrane protein assembly factor BamE (lipoprotein component of BamABCDE complex)
VRSLNKWTLLLAAALLAGCAGTKFVRPADSELELGKTTEQQVMARMGTPFQQATGVTNGKATRTLGYAYASMGGQAKNPGVTPVNALTLVFHEGKLVSKSYLSNLKEDATDFDGSKAVAVESGKTTMAQVKAMFGPAPGEAVYPAIKHPSGRALIYSYQEMRGFTPSTKILTVVFDAKDTVVDVDYQNTGTWK